MNDNDKKFIEFIHKNGEEWLLQLPADGWRTLLNGAYKAYSELFQDDFPGEPKLDDEAVLMEAEANPHKVRALLQALGASSPEMVALVWRVINGDAIMAIDLHYLLEQEFRLTVQIENSLTGRKVTVTSREIEDATILRHIGILRMDDKPMFEGYFPLDATK